MGITQTEDRLRGDVRPAPDRPPRTTRSPRPAEEAIDRPNPFCLELTRPGPTRKGPPPRTALPAPPRGRLPGPPTRTGAPAADVPALTRPSRVRGGGGRGAGGAEGDRKGGAAPDDACPDAVRLGREGRARPGHLRHPGRH